MTIANFYKTTDAVLDYTLDWTDFLGDTDNILDSDWSVSSNDISISTDTYTNKTTTAFISGGVADNSYDITNTITTLLGRTTSRVISIFVTVEPNELSDLVTALRLHLGDIDSSSYRYMDKWLMTALETAIMALQRWWGDKYLIDFSGDYVYRNPDSTFVEDAPPEIEHRDRRPIVLMAAILVKSGQLESNSWQVGSWKDAEIAVSNIEGSRSKQFGINLDWTELQMYLKPPGKKLFGGVRTSLPNENLWIN